MVTLKLKNSQVCVKTVTLLLLIIIGVRVSWS